MESNVTSAENAFLALTELRESDVEELWVLALGPSKAIIEKRMIFRGTVDSCMVHPREIFRFAILANASSILIAHNHPSGEMLASQEDIKFTKQLIEAGRVMEIPVVDHLIVTRHTFTSIRADGYAKFHGNLSAVSED